MVPLKELDQNWPEIFEIDKDYYWNAYTVGTGYCDYRPLTRISACDTIFAWSQRSRNIQYLLY